jgi:hypothetical protein
MGFSVGDVSPSVGATTVSASVCAGVTVASVGEGRLVAVGLQLVRSRVPINNTATQRNVEVVRIYGPFKTPLPRASLFKNMAGKGFKY